MKRSIFIAVIGLFLLGILTGCCRLVLYDDDYTGRVVDADTGEPIEGAVVLGIWYSISSTVAGAHHSFDDCRETTTDAKGEFTVPGQGLRVLSCLNTMNVTIFKSGYEYLNFNWDALKEGYGRRRKILWDDNIPAIPLRILTLEERRKQWEPPFPTEAYEKKMIPIFINEVIREQIALGYPTYSQ